MGDINRRKGLILDSGAAGDDTVVTATVPLDAMFGYSTVLRSATQVNIDSVNITFYHCFYFISLFSSVHRHRAAGRHVWPQHRARQRR